MSGMTATEMGGVLDHIRMQIRKKAKRIRGFRGGDTIDRLIDMVVAPLVLDAVSGRYGSIDRAATDVGEDLREVLSKKTR